MSTNPFRRSSLKGPSGSSGGFENNPITSAPIDIPDTGTDTSTPLTVNTKAPVSLQKHVNFASPPAIPISPVSYPPSPESTRLSPEYTFAKTALPAPIDYSDAIQSDPFRAEASNEDDDGVIEQALQNAKVNTTLVAPNLEEWKQDAVKNTLSRFASAPRRTDVGDRDYPPQQASAPNRQTMDVDAFKRLLLTGDRGTSTQQEDAAISAPPSGPPVTSDNGSGTDTASISQRSVFDQTTTYNDSPRSSDEIDPIEAEVIRHSITTNEKVEGRKKPPPPAPAPRHGKLIKEDPVPENYTDPASSQTSLASSIAKTAPTPPLARKHSQNSGALRPTSSRNSSSGELNTATASTESPSLTSTRGAPPPPRPRRPVSTMDRRSSSDLPTTLEESDSAGTSITPSRKPSDSRPAPPPARNSSKRVSMSTMSAPPLPPPRRGRGSSRSSIDSQRPSVSAILNNSGVEPTSGEFIQSGIDGRRVSSSMHTNDILADLAALQREVDEARRKAGR